MRQPKDASSDSHKITPSQNHVFQRTAYRVFLDAAFPFTDPTLPSIVVPSDVAVDVDGEGELLIHVC